MLLYRTLGKWINKAAVYISKFSQTIKMNYLKKQQNLMNQSGLLKLLDNLSTKSF